MSYELTILLWVTLLMMLLWVPYILAEINKHGIVAALGYKTDRALPGWAARLKQAHYNSVENYAPFAVVVVAGEFANVHNGVTAACALVFLIARIAHPVAQIMQVWGSRTIAFAIGWAASAIYLLTVLTAG